MNENIELVQYIYKSSEMGVYSSENILNSINGKENKIIKDVENILKEYEKYKKESKKIIKKNKYELVNNSIKTKIGSMMGIKMEVTNDNSDSAIAHLMIEGLTMGVVDIESKINRFDKEVDKKIMKLAKDYLNFHNNYIKLLKKYL